MISPLTLDNEQDRLEALYSYAILDTLPEEDFDNLTAIASQICGTQISLVSLIDRDRQWIKSHHGIVIKETPREYAFCAHAIYATYDIMIVEDAHKDERFHDNPMVTGAPHIGFYAGVPLVSDNGFALGTLCVIDEQPKKLNQSQIDSLKALGQQVMSQLNLRKKKQELEKTLSLLEDKNNELEKFAYLAAHDLKSPLASIAVLTQMLKTSSGAKLDPVATGQLEMIQNSAERLKSLVDGLLEYNTCLESCSNEFMNVNLKSFEMELSQIFAARPECKITWKPDVPVVRTNYSALKHIMTELIDNAIRYNYKELVKVDISVSETNQEYLFKVKDNSAGFAEKDKDRVLEVFQVVHIPDRFNEIGNGIGLATVKKVLNHIGGSIDVKSEEGKGSEFAFTLKK